MSHSSAGRLSGKVAFVTGAASGVGEAVARLFAAEGASVVVADISEAGRSVAQSLEARGSSALFVRLDVTRPADVEAAVREAVQRFGGLDVLVNCAGTAMPFTPVESVTDEMWQATIDVNLRGVFHTCRAAVPILKARGQGAIVNVASVAGVRARPGLTAYCAAKAGVILFTRALALELAPHGVRANALLPGPTRTPMLARFTPHLTPEEGGRRFIESVPLGRLAEPEEIARAALFLASDEASFVTGACLGADGGRGI